MKHLVLILALGSLFVVSAQATTYVRVEKDGSKTYSDRPIPGGQVVETQPVQTYTAPPSAPSPRPREEPDYDFKYQSCVVSPENNTTFTNPESVAISVTVIPAMPVEHVLTLSIDGRALPPNTTSYLMKPVDRGTHTASLTIKGKNGQVLCTANSSFHVMRPTLNSPARSR